MTRLSVVLLAVASACGSSEVLIATDGMEDGELVDAATSQAAITCSPRMSVFPVKARHNIGYDSASCGSGTCVTSCPDANANSDWGGGHHGIDIFAFQRAPLVAVVSGTIVRVGTVSSTSGIRVRLRDSCGWEYYYGHLDQAVVTQGQQVSAGQLIGYMGRTGTASTHLHFNVSPDGNYSSDINPFTLLKTTSPTACASAPPASTPGFTVPSGVDFSFDPAFYLRVHADLMSAYGAGNTSAATTHWNQYGRAEGRLSSPIFSARHYLQTHPDVNAWAGGSNSKAVDHWLEWGVNEGRASSPNFDARYYLALHPDLQAALGTNARSAAYHYLAFGLPEGRRASSAFDPRYYLSVNPDVAAAYGATNYRAALEHWLVFGRAEGRRAVP